ncbi:hydrophobic protein [Psittacine adenovirus 2]|uniref:Hydrophobic protein n=1 Tax=Psittacine adenovirus 2 TaxID=1301246 RepID=A0ABX8SN85_9ADEN|nr:hydrophobic protein [Psittacine adenovirus 2]QZW33241.1 ORF02 hypothetical protein [Psittacine siadenovirus F]QZW33685.1 ORF02 hypothetical protein [Psittacine adenovirus 2]WGL41010.1 hypothetical protein [Psittacine siadenovirus F]WGL41035.1 hypothetical protein [Psittacine siadenovirus F]
MALICGGCSTYCQQCVKLCGRAAKKKRYSSRISPLARPVHLKYVRYYPGTVPTPGWAGVDQLLSVPGVQASYPASVVKSNAGTVDVFESPVKNAGFVRLSVSGRKRKKD